MFRYEFYDGLSSEKRYMQIGTIHGSVESCSNRYPGIYVRIEEPSVLQFLKYRGQINGQSIHTASKKGLLIALMSLTSH